VSVSTKNLQIVAMHTVTHAPEMARGKNNNAKRRPSRGAQLFSPTIISSVSAEVPIQGVTLAISVENDCVECGSVHVDKFDTSLMCAYGHTTCFPCVAEGIQPHPICTAHCNGFMYKCAECGTWSCVSKIQELAMLCGRHSTARARLRKNRIRLVDFERSRVCTCQDTTSGDDTPSEDESGYHSSEDNGTETECSSSHDVAGEIAPFVQLPRVCSIDWSHGRAERTERLERLRANLLGRRCVFGS